MFKKIGEMFKSFYNKIIKSDRSPHKIALAMAIGLFVGCFVPPVGLQTVFAIALAFVFRTDKIIAYGATWITANPYTFVSLYPLFAYLGAKLIYPSLKFIQIKDAFIQLFTDFSYADFIKGLSGIFYKVFMSYLVGGLICGIIIGIVGYFITYKIVVRYRKSKQVKNA